MGFMYVFIALLATLVFVLLEAMLANPIGAEGYADQLCKELYGPQTGATWEKGTLMCETAKGEIIEVRKIK
jgi:hypothetical protein